MLEENFLRNLNTASSDSATDQYTFERRCKEQCGTMMAFNAKYKNPDGTKFVPSAAT